VSFRHLWDLPADVPAGWAARRRLAAALRDLSDRCVTTDLDAASLDALAAEAEALAARLPPGTTSSQHWAAGSYDEHVQELIDRTALVGLSNPLAPPLDITNDGTTARCEIVLGERFVGAPGLAHGGVIAAIYDQMMGHAVLWTDRSGLTVSLRVRYRLPTPLHTPLVFTATVTEAQGRNTLVSAACHRDGERLSSCEGHFVRIDPNRVQAVFGPDGR